jgi:lipopolysaccharide transport system ATP-binding protein
MMENNDVSKVSETSINGPTNGSQEALISVRGVSKKFCRSLKSSYAYGLRDIASEVLGTSRHSEQLRKGEFWAIQDISFDVEKGDSLGLIGVNGSGKTTLLRIIGGLIKPDTGSIIVRGRVAALIALGAGFNPILTGRENIYINMSILGLTKNDIDQKFDAVLSFAEIRL